MERCLRKCSPCVVCGVDARQHAGWFLLVENRWLDRLKILSWHPVLATQEQMLSVCGKQHLKALMAHWLTQANLELQSTGNEIAPITSESQIEPEPDPHTVGQFVGELAVHRESFSRVWTGSPETLECILAALIGGVESKPRTIDYSLLGLSADHSHELALH